MYVNNVRIVYIDFSTMYIYIYIANAISVLYVIACVTDLWYMWMYLFVNNTYYVQFNVLEYEIIWFQKW